jgi:hypothetical protein
MHIGDKVAVGQPFVVVQSQVCCAPVPDHIACGAYLQRQIMDVGRCYDKVSDQGVYAATHADGVVPVVPKPVGCAVRLNEQV